MRIQSYPLPAHPEAESLSQAEPTNMMEAHQPQQLERVSSLSAVDLSSVEVAKKSNTSSSQRNAGGVDDVECDTKVRCAAAFSRPRRCSIDTIVLATFCEKGRSHSNHHSFFFSIFFLREFSEISPTGAEFP
jgi:hypothetical protein